MSFAQYLQPVDSTDPASGPAAFLAFARRGKPGGWRYLVAAAATVLLAMLAAFVLVVVLALTRALPPDAVQRMQNPADAVPFYLGSVAMPFALFLAGLMLSARLALGRPFADFLGRWRWSMTARGFGVWFVLLAVGELVDYAAAPHGFSWIGGKATGPFFLVAPPALALQTFAEEAVFRGLVTQGLLLWLRRPLPTAVASGLIFGAFHLLNGPFQALNAVVIGVVLALVAIETGGLAMGWGVHLANNLFAAMVVVSTGDVFRAGQGLIRQDTPGLPWLDFAFTLVALALITWFSMDGRAKRRFVSFRTKIGQ